MKAVIQRVSKASVTVEGKIISTIADGLLVLLGIENEDNKSDIDWLSRKIVNLRIFNDENGVMNMSLIEKGGDAIVVSQFTLHASTKKGNRPSYLKAAKPEVSIPSIRGICSTIGDDLRKKSRYGYIWCRYESRPCERWSGNHYNRYKK